jgi:hypothetical protein
VLIPGPKDGAQPLAVDNRDRGARHRNPRQLVWLAVSGETVEKTDT